MSEWSSFYIGGNRISGWPNGIGAEVSVLFTEDDVTRTPHPNWIDHWDLSEGDGHIDELPCFQYESARNVRRSYLRTK